VSIKLLIMGAGTAGKMVVGELCAHPESGLDPVAFVDDDPAKQGTEISGIPVAGGHKDIPRLLKEFDADEILIALPSVHGRITRDIMATCRSLRVRFRIVTPILEIVRGDIRLDLGQIRTVKPEDLLGRQSVEPDRELIAEAYAGKRILVTGAGGSIGGELSRQLLDADPERLVLLGRGENSLFETGVRLENECPGARFELALTDVRYGEGLRRVMERVKPQIILHAAAHKHVTFMEQYPEEAVFNNILGTRDLVTAAEAVGAERFVMLSTDKAVNPSGVMGASKRVAELVLGERAAAGSPVRLMAVRFGNVLGSRGSVVPLFLRQIAAGGPVTVSDPDVCRYFMTVKEAAMLVLKAGAVGTGGEVFILDMGEQIRIQDLARDLITLSGYRPEEDIAIRITGLKPGEKVREELTHDFEELSPTSLPKIRTARRVRGETVPLEPVLKKLAAQAASVDRAGIRRTLMELLPEADIPTGEEAGV